MGEKITYLTHACLITCVVESGKSDIVIDAASAAGAQGSVVNYARGRGIKEKMGLMGVVIENEKEVLRFIVSEEQSNHIFTEIYKASQMDVPGRGIMFMQKLDRVATYIPPQIADESELTDG